MTDPARVQRWFRQFDTAPRDGTPFAVVNIIRRNPFGDHWEALYLNPETGERTWQPFDWPENNEPRWWCVPPPLRFELPNQGWFAMQYEVVIETVVESWIARCTKRFWRAAQPKEINP